MYDVRHRLGVRAGQRPAAPAARPARPPPAGRSTTVEMTDAQDRDISHLLQGHEAADQDGDRARARPAGAAARRAVQRHGPAPAAAPDGPAARRWATQGRTVLFSSHILEEVEQIAGRIEVMVAGRHAASGDFREIRRLMTERPHQYTIRSERRPGAGRGDHRRRQRLRGRARARRAATGRPAGRPSACTCRPPTSRAFVRAAAAARRRPASGSTRSRPPTSRWRASSPTWWRDERRRPSPASPPRSLLGRRRALLLLALPAACCSCSGRRCVRGARRAGRRASPSASLGGFALGTLVPLLGLIAGTGAIGPEIDDGSIVYLLAKPLQPALDRRHQARSWPSAVVARLRCAADAASPALILVRDGRRPRASASRSARPVAGDRPTARCSCCSRVVTRNAVVVGLLYALIWETWSAASCPGAQDAEHPAVGARDHRARRRAHGAEELGVTSAVGLGRGVPLLLVVVVGVHLVRRAPAAHACGSPATSDGSRSSLRR